MERVSLGEGGVESISLASSCDGLTYTQLLDHGYGLTPSAQQAQVCSFSLPNSLLDAFWCRHILLSFLLIFLNGIYHIIFQ